MVHLGSAMNSATLESADGASSFPSNRAAPRPPGALLWYLGLAVAVSGALVGLIRLLGVMWVGHYHKILIPLSILAAVLLMKARGRIRVDGLSLCLFLALWLGSLVGILHGGAARQMLSHFGAALFAFTVYTAARLTIPDAEWLKSFWRRASYMILIAYGVSIAAFWTIGAVTGRVLYLGIGTGDVMFAFCYFIVYRMRFATFLCAVVIILSGKRGTLLSMLATVLYTVRLPFFRRFYVRSIFAAGAGICFILLTLYLREPIMSVAWPSAISSVLDKWYQVDPFAEAFNIDVAFSGRNLELSLAFTKFVQQSHHWLVGMGFGWSYFFDARIEGSETTDFFSHYVHLSPANFVLLHGAPFAIVTLFLMLRVIAVGYRTSRSNTTSGKMQRVLALFCISAFVSSLSGYMYATDPFFWISLGALSSTRIWRLDKQTAN